MKNKILSICIAFVCIACKAQTIIPIFGEPTTQNTAGAYFKDTFNDFDNFTGTWEYQSGNTQLIIILKKRINFHNVFSNLYEDIIYGEYKYIENGVEKINTLTALSNPFPDPYNHNIVGNGLNTPDKFPLCPTCPAGQKRLHLSLNDPLRASVKGLIGDVVLRRVDTGSIQKIEILLKPQGNIIYTEGNPPQYTSLNIPWGTYVLTRIN